MRCQVIDLHAHLDLYPDPAATTKEYIRPVRDNHAFRLVWHLPCERRRGIRTAIGLHPQIAQERQGELALFDELRPRSRYVGEIGLDGGPELKATWDVQRRVFDEFCACAAIIRSSFCCWGPCTSETTSARALSGPRSAAAVFAATAVLVLLDSFSTNA